MKQMETLFKEWIPISLIIKIIITYKMIRITIKIYQHSSKWTILKANINNFVIIINWFQNHNNTQFIVKLIRLNMIWLCHCKKWQMIKIKVINKIKILSILNLNKHWEMLHLREEQRCIHGLYFL
jgi:hypothetical protein